MKKNENKPVKKSIDRMRQKLHKLIEAGNVDSEIVIKTSCELDELVNLYYNTLESEKKREGDPRA